MATAAVTHSFAANTLIESAEVNDNFDDLVSFINTNVIQKDASVAFTSVPSGPSSDPSSDNQFARKRYVDRKSQHDFVTLTFTADSARSGTITFPETFTTTPNVQFTVQCGSNFDLVANMTAAPSTTGVNYRVFHKDGTSITGSARLYWSAFGPY